jgi:hypothetical protein
MADDLTQMTDDELAAYRQAADDEMSVSRDKKDAVKQEILRREAQAALDPMLEAMSDDQKAALAQHISDFTAGEQGEMGGLS